MPHPRFDNLEFDSISNLYNHFSKSVYNGGLRILLATCKIFYETCLEYGISVPDFNFEIRYIYLSLVIIFIFICLFIFHYLYIYIVMILQSLVKLVYQVLAQSLPP